MKHFYLLLLMASGVMQSQVDGPILGEFIDNIDHSQCVTAEQRELIFQKLAVSRQQLTAQGILPDPDAGRMLGAHPLFEWPMAKNPVVPYEHVWGLSNYVDHNLSFPNQTQDWNCGPKTYDTAQGYNHAGMDIFLWPFSWHQFQNNHAWVIAAADGIIIEKEDGNFDMSCAMGSGQWNAIYIMHPDGSMAWYGHMKAGTLTEKGIGESVSTGEFLGVVGSSGSSTGPHLHFEVYNSAMQLVDPYVGPCNNWSSSDDTWWAQQQPYIQPKINAVLTHSGVPTFPACPQTETPKIKDSFTSSETVYGAIYLTDQTVGSTGVLQLKRPNGTTAYLSNFNSTAAYSASYWYWVFTPSYFDMYGTWVLSFSYNGNLVEHQFVYGSDLGIDDQGNPQSIAFYPNPATDRIAFAKEITRLEVYNIDGKQLQIPYDAGSADVSGLPKGVFLLRGNHLSGKQFTAKLIK